ncbi:fibronectin type III domain-containing protein [Gracilimonas sediminicola]|uniref:Fibronectin type III domain-containing protein n=1 Tax=Gracilimonas sediminicola TaxID=2952158 RepID=A0A9X2L1G8_9BACT|nr:fibronectin type III domain-containing protein [Gracilimonas sediminicola]MCP9290479.1 fibronectin type III domain-containing protein [Gracilimonas sediminicola]
MKKYILFILFFIFGLLLSNCSTGPDFERENSRDPAAGNFQPNMHSLQVELNNDKTVTLNWKDGSGFEDGIIIAKSLGENGLFTILDTLSANSVSYTDNSKLLDLNTTYFIGGFKNGTTPIDSSRFLSRRLDFGEMQEINYTSIGNEITLNWSSSLTYADKFVITGSEDGTLSTIIDTVDGNKSDLTFLVDYESYSMDLKVSALLLNHEDELVIIDQKTKARAAFNLPTFSGLTLVNEAIINLSITDHSSFDDEFIVYERTRSAWHQPYSEFIPIDTVASSGNIFITKNENNDREYAIAAIYQNKKSGLSEPIELDFISAPPYIGENVFTSVSPTSVKLTWIDGNSEAGRPSTYQFELYLYNSETDELLRQINIPPSETEYTIDNLNPSIKYEFVLKTYNSRTPDPISFSVETSLEEVDAFFMARNDGIDDAKILANQELIVYSPNQYGASGLKVFDLNTNSYQTIYDTGEDQSEYEGKFIEDFSITENLELIATNRTVTNEYTGEKNSFIYVMDKSSGTPVYFKKQLSRNSNEDIYLAGFISETELIYIYNDSYSEGKLKVHKWNFYTNETEKIFERHRLEYSSSYIDNDKILIGAAYAGIGLLVLSKDGAVIHDIPEPYFGETVLQIDPSSVPNSYNLNISETLYRYNISTNTTERFEDLNYIDSFMEVSQHNLILSNRGYYLNFTDLNTGSRIYSLYDPERNFSFQNGAFLPNRNQVLLQFGERIKIFDVKVDWVTTN